jgi:uncharacterized protein GlcG (DUF336 family)
METLENRQLMAITPNTDVRLTESDVEKILARAGSQMLPTQIAVVVDRNGAILGILGGPRSKVAGVRDANGKANPLLGTLVKALTRARTGAFFQSTQDAFTTRTARFIIQDHFPHPVPNTPGGPLYGVQFSSLPFSDVVSGPAISGDPGGLPLFKDGVPVGGVGVAGDLSDVIARDEFAEIGFYDPKTSSPGRVFNGTEEKDVDEQVALAAAKGLEAPSGIVATKIFIDGLRFPYTRDKAKGDQAARSLDTLVANGFRLLNGNASGLPVETVPFGSVASVGRGGDSTKPRGGFESPFPTATFSGFKGELKNTNPEAPNFGIIGSNDTKGGVLRDDADRLTAKDVNNIIADAVKQALDLRAAIRRPTGVPVIVHITVVDRDGDLLGAFRMDDGTIFSYDVAVQKARTAAFFSDNDLAMTSRAVGFVSQRYFPIGISDPKQDRTGPLFGVQPGLSLGLLEANNFAETTPGNAAEGTAGGAKNPIRNGLTIFAGGAPLYKNGKLVGAIGVSGDGIDQDDQVAYAGTKRFRPPAGIRSDERDDDVISARLANKVNFLFDNYTFANKLDANGAVAPTLTRDEVLSRLAEDLDGVRLPYVKFGTRNPEI